jgi:hypothetical protein
VYLRKFWNEKQYFERVEIEGFVKKSASFWLLKLAYIYALAAIKTNMPRHRILTLIIIITLSSTTYSQNFDALTSQIFFNIDIKKQDTIVLSDFNARPELTLKKDTGWTAYPPTDEKGNAIPFYTFAFSKHPYFTSDFNSGRLMIMTNVASDRTIRMSLSLSFNSAQTFDSTYKRIKKLYSKYSSKTIKRPNIARPFEVTKYVSKGDNDYVIITKGESNNKPYIHIACNYQDFDW